jgi:hypothetical protein
MSLARFVSDLVGTLSSYFKINTVRLKDNSGILQVRDTGDAAFAKLDTHTLGLQGSNASYQVSLTAPAGLAADYDIALPATDGSAGQVLKTNGDGTTEWTAAVSNAELCQELVFDETTSSPATIFTPPANAVLTRCQIQVTVAAAGGSPTVSIGISGDADRDMDELEAQLLTAALYEVQPMTDVGGTPDAVILTITPDSQEFDGEARVWYVIPA